MISLEKGKKLVKLARESISCVLDGKELKVSEVLKKEFKDERGVFVTLYLKKELAGCIGFPEPIMPLWRAVVDGARAAGFNDPRFRGISKEDLKDLKIEVSVLTVPEEIKVKKSSEYVSKVKIGLDGLIIRDINGSGLLLPQVAVEYKWSSEEFLSYVCEKAGLDKDYWKRINKGIFKFQAQIFSEEKGIIVEKKL